MPVQEVIQIPVMHTGLELPYTNLSALDNWTSSCIVSGNLVADLRGLTDFQPGNYSMILKDRRAETWHQNELNVNQ